MARQGITAPRGVNTGMKNGPEETWEAEQEALRVARPGPESLAVLSEVGVGQSRPHHHLVGGQGSWV